MNIKSYKKRYTIALLISIAGLAGALPFLFNNSSKIQINQGSSVEESVRTAIEQEHTEIIEAVRNDFNIPADAWNTAMNEFKALRAADNLLLNKPATAYKKTKDPLVNHIKELLASECINPDKVTIAYVDNKECPLLAVQEFADNNIIQHSIQIDKEWFQKRPSQIQDAIIRHEMEHLKHYDSIEGGYMIDIVMEYDYSRDDYEKSKAVRNYRHQREIRADVLAGVKDVDVAKALQQDFAQCMAHNQAEDNHHHPASSLRFEQMAKLINNLNTENQQNALT